MVLSFVSVFKYLLFVALSLVSTLGQNLDFHVHPSPPTFGVLSGPHTTSIGNNLVLGLQKFGIKAELFDIVPPTHDLDYYIVLTPQVFKNQTLPSLSKLIIYQLEQTISSRWLSKAYVSDMKNCKAVLDYNMLNIEYFRRRKVRTPTSYLPMGVTPEARLPQNSQSVFGSSFNVFKDDFDILFYGDGSNVRRKTLLAHVKNAFPGRVKCVSNVFGGEIKSLIKQSKVVINIHYYENGLLETPRLFETLALGTPVVSEDSQDSYLYPELSKLVTYFPLNSETGMILAIKQVLERPPIPQMFEDFYEITRQKFSLMLGRFLIYNGMIGASVYNSLPVLSTISPQHQVVLSPPEFANRRQMFLSMGSNLTSQFALYDGFLHPVRWVGCGMSYSRLAQYAIANNIQHLTVSEDDAEFPSNYTQTIKLIRSYLHQRADWDMFSGLIAVVPESVVVSKAEWYEGHLFATINTCSSTVFNIYNQSMLKKFSKWDVILQDGVSARTIQRFGTIDRHMVAGGAKIVVMLPFFVRHRANSVSTLWNSKINNAELYEKSIIAAESMLFARASAIATGTPNHVQQPRYTPTIFPPPANAENKPEVRDISRGKRHHNVIQSSSQTIVKSSSPDVESW